MSFIKIPPTFCLQNKNQGKERAMNEYTQEYIFLGTISHFLCSAEFIYTRIYRPFQHFARAFAHEFGHAVGISMPYNNKYISQFNIYFTSYSRCEFVTQSSMYKMYVYWWIVSLDDDDFISFGSLLKCDPDIMTTLDI